MNLCFLNNCPLLLFLKFYWSIVDLQRCVSGTQQSNWVICCLVAKSCPTLCDPMDYNLPGSSVHEISQARILEQVAIFFCKDSSYTCSFFFHFFSESFLIQITTDYQVEFPVLYGSSFLVIYLLYSGVCVHTCVYAKWLQSCPILCNWDSQFLGRLIRSLGVPKERGVCSSLQRGLQRRKKGQTFFPLHSLGLYNNNVSCLRT